MAINQISNDCRGPVKCISTSHSNQTMEDTRTRTTENHQPLILICLVLATLAFATVVQKIMSTQPTEVKKDNKGTDKCAGDSGDVIDNCAGKTAADGNEENEEEEESDSDGDEYEDDDDDEINNLDLDVPIKNSYGITDGPFKMILCINMSLSMGKGKMCAQCGHATLGAYIKAQKHCDSAILWWQRMGQVKTDDLRITLFPFLNFISSTMQVESDVKFYFCQAKVAVKVDNDEALFELARMAQLKGLVTYIVEDAGRTQIAAGSKTVLAIGPAPVSVFEGLTGHLKLL